MKRNKEWTEQEAQGQSQLLWWSQHLRYEHTGDRDGFWISLTPITRATARIARTDT